MQLVNFSSAIIKKMKIIEKLLKKLSETEKEKPKKVQNLKLNAGVLIMDAKEKAKMALNKK